MTRVAIMGASGRMGVALTRAAAADPGVTISGGLVRAGCAAAGQDMGMFAGIGETGVIATEEIESAIADADVVLDFTLPDATDTILRACVDEAVPLVIGTTGLSDEQHRAIATASGRIPLVYGANMSVGVNLMLRLAMLAGRVLGEAYDAEIVDAHHRHKRDAPSGTALALGDAIVAGRSGDAVREMGRGPDSVARKRGAIGFSSIRGGDIVGEHTVLLAGEGERLELTHRASDRASYASGALRAARWVEGREPGLYSMAEVLGLD